MLIMNHRKSMRSILRNKRVRGWFKLFTDLALFDILEMTNKDLTRNIERFTRKTMKSRRFREMRGNT